MASTTSRARLTVRARLAAAAALICTPVAAREPLDLAKYVCTRTDDGKSVAGDRLEAAAFQIASRARFGDANLMLIDPKTSVRANCFARTAPSK